MDLIIHCTVILLYDVQNEYAQQTMVNCRVKKIRVRECSGEGRVKSFSY